LRRERAERDGQAKLKAESADATLRQIERNTRPRRTRSSMTIKQKAEYISRFGVDKYLQLPK
jgi:hypothetical protein